MALVWADKVIEQSTTTTTGAYQLSGVPSGMPAGSQIFVAGIGNGNTCYYEAQEVGGTSYERGIGTVTDADTDTLTRTTIHKSSNADAAVNWSGKTVQIRNVLSSTALGTFSTDAELATHVTADDHTQYALLAGRTTGQTLTGGTAVSATLTLQSTSNATKGKVLFGASAYDEVNNRLGIAYNTPAARLDIAGDLTTASLGAEQITALANRDFSAAGNWSGTNWTVGSGVATHTAGANAFTLAAAGLDPDPVAGGIYQIIFTTNTTTAGTITVSIGSIDGIAVGQVTGTDTQTQVVTAADTGALTFTPDATWAGTLDNISVTRITPSNATQIVRNSDNTIGLEIRAGGAGLDNAFIGKDAGLSNTTGSTNLFLGGYAGISNTTGFGNLFLGVGAGYYNTAGFGNLFLGSDAGVSNTTGGYNLYLGHSAGGAAGTESSSIGLGYQTTVTASNQLVIGSADPNGSITAAYFGQGVTKTSPAGITLNATGGIGTNNAGAPLTIAGGKGTGNAAGGSLIFQTSNAGASGATLQSLTTKMTLLASGNFGVGMTTPTAVLHLKAGTATANTAPFKLTSGTVMTTPETGAVEYNGTNLLFTRTGTTRESVMTALAVNTVTPTAPDRTVSVVIDGTTYYLHAKTTNN